MATRPLFGEPKISRSFNSNESIILHRGDALDFLKDLPSNLISLVVTSPPYNLGKVYERKRALEVYLDEQTKVIDELIRTLRDDGSICWEVGNFVDDGSTLCQRCGDLVMCGEHRCPTTYANLCPKIVL